MAPASERRRVSYPVSDSMVLHPSSACASAVRPNAPCGANGRMASGIASRFSRSRPPPPAGLHPTTPSVGQTSGATQRCLNPGFSERIGNSRRTGRCPPTMTSWKSAESSWRKGARFGLRRYDNRCPQRYGFFFKRLQRLARRVVVVHPGHLLLIFRSNQNAKRSSRRREAYQGVILGLEIRLVQPERVFQDRAVDASVTRPPRHPASHIVDPMAINRSTQNVASTWLIHDHTFGCAAVAIRLPIAPSVRRRRVRPAS